MPSDVKQSGVKLPDGSEVPGNGPIVIIGPNGVGKTRMGVRITHDNDAERIAALRYIELPTISMQRAEQARNQVNSALSETLSQPWQHSNELQHLFSEILAEDRDCAVQFRAQMQGDPPVTPDESLTKTRLTKIVDIWNDHFPGRQIDIDYESTVGRTINGVAANYPTARMSEGERTALYLAARVVSCTHQIIVVDEPETFLHPLLARALWNSLEDLKPEVRFVYITHDIPFALSRREARFVIARSETTAELLPVKSSIPSEVFADVLGAASFSVSASRLVFCEGDPNSIDNSILTAWHDCPKTVVVPVGGCDAVRECVSVFRSGSVTRGVEAYGYIDRDGWPDALLASDEFVKAHPVSEIEGYLCIESVFKAVGRYKGLEEPELSSRYAAFLNEARGQFKNILFNKEVLNRAKKRAEWEQKALLNPIKPHADMGTLTSEFESAQPSGGWANYLATAFREEKERLTTSHSNTEYFLRDFPAKSYYVIAAKRLDVMPNDLIRTICEALQLSDETADKNERLKTLRNVIVTAMSSYMWPRRV